MPSNFNKLKKVVGKVPMPNSTRSRLKELYRQWTLAVTHKSGSKTIFTSKKEFSNKNSNSVIDLLLINKDYTGLDFASTELATSIKVYQSFDQYLNDADDRNILRLKRNEFEMGLLASDQKSFTYSAYCSVCRTERNFEVDYFYAYLKNEEGRLIPNWRESLVCEYCRMNNRIRAVVDLLSHQIAFNEEYLIYATEQLTPFYQWLRNNYSNVIGSEFLGDDRSGGELYNNLRHEDITCLSFPDSSIDAILSFEVLEHVPDTEGSITEFLRVLKKGGFVLVSVPFASNNHQTLVRAEISQDGTINHILEPEYHGNPTNPDEGSLCFYHFGWDLVDKFKAAGATDAAVISYYSVTNANLGNEQLFFLILK